jgi:hypothetical protein
MKFITYKSLFFYKQLIIVYFYFGDSMWRFIIKYFNSDCVHIYANNFNLISQTARVL